MYVCLVDGEHLSVRDDHSSLSPLSFSTDINSVYNLSKANMDYITGFYITINDRLSAAALISFSLS